MSSKTLREDKQQRLVKSMMFSQRCLGIVLKRAPDNKALLLAGGGGGGRELLLLSNEGEGGSQQQQEATSNGSVDPNAEDWMFESGYLIFQDFQEENRHCFWNQGLVDSLNNVEYMGFVAPGTLLVGGNEYYLEGLRSAWARRVLKPPANYYITRLGDVTGFDIQVIPQIQFTPLPEALCLVISDLNQQGQTASLQIICSQLQERFSDMIVPNEDLIYSSLGKLIKDRKIYHTGDGYFIVTPETYRLTTVSPLPERPILMTNEEAIHKLHGNEIRIAVNKVAATLRSRSIQANMDEVAQGKSPERTIDRTTTPTRLERFGSMRLSRKEKSHSEDDESFFRRRDSLHLSPERSKSLVKDINLKTSPAHQDIDKGEKVSVFHKLFRRSSSKRRKGSKSPTKYATFAAQFPPLEWGDPTHIHYQSRATQTLEHRSPKDKLSSTHSLRSKTDSLTRLRDHEKRHHRSHTLSLDSPRKERHSRLDEPTPTASRSSLKSSSIPRRSFPASTTPDSYFSSKKQAGNTSSLTRTDKRHRRAESCTLIPTTKDRYAKSLTGSPEKHAAASAAAAAAAAATAGAAKEKSDDVVKLNNAELKNDEDYRAVNDSFGSAYANNTLPKTKVAPYRIVPSTPNTTKDVPCKMNNAADKANALAAKWEPSATIRRVNQLNSPPDEKNGKTAGLEKEDATDADLAPTTRHRLSTSSSISLGCEFDVTFTSLAAQKILTGASINSIDTLLEVNMAAEKTPGTNGVASAKKTIGSVLDADSPVVAKESPSSPTYKGFHVSYSTKIKNDSADLLENNPVRELKMMNSNVGGDPLKKGRADSSDMTKTRVLGIV